MKAVHIFGHNAVLVRDKKGEQYMATGKGIGFKKEAGDKINPHLIQNLFIEDENFDHRFVTRN